MEIKEALSAARSAAAADSAASAALSAGVSALSAPARSTANAAARSAVQSAARSAAVSAALSARSAARSASSARATAEFADLSTHSAVWQQISRDCNFIKGETAGKGSYLAAKLSRQPLWYQIPGAVLAPWRKIEKILLDADEGWDVWTTWYQRRITGGPWNEALEVERVISPSIPWSSGDPAQINAALQTIEDKHNPVSTNTDQAASFAPEVRATRAEFLIANREVAKPLLSGCSSDIDTALAEFCNATGLNQLPPELALIEAVAKNLSQISDAVDGEKQALEARIAGLEAELDTLKSSNLHAFWSSFHNENGKQAAITLHKIVRGSICAGAIYVFGDAVSAKLLPDLLKILGK